MEEIRFNVSINMTEILGGSLFGKRTAMDHARPKIMMELQKKVAEGYDIELTPEALHNRHQLLMVESPNNHYAANFVVTLYANKKSPDQLYREQFDYFINR